MSRLDPKAWSDSARYPNYTPHKFGSPTSAEAARRFEPKRESLEDVVRFLLTDYGPLTDFELQAHAEQKGIRSLLRPRRATLTARGEVIDSGMTRTAPSGQQATVWRLA